MNKRAVLIVVTVLILGAIVGILFMKNPAKAPSESGTSTTTNSTENKQDSEADITPVATDMVEIKDFAFSPAAITVKKGTKVTWTNKDSTQHNISPDTETADFKASELLAQGESYSVTFNTVGTFSYHCTPHPYMKASVIVTE
jgi:amicyanin